MDIDLHVKYQLFLSDFNENLTFSADFRKILKNKISWKSVQWEPRCSVRTDGQTDRQTEMTKLIVAFRTLANTPKYVHVRMGLPLNYVHEQIVIFIILFSSTYY